MKVGLSRIYFARFVSDGFNNVTYKDGFRAARAINHKYTPGSASSNADARADNGIAESASGETSGGDISLEVAELTTKASAFLYGLKPRTRKVGEKEVIEYGYGETNKPQNVGYGFIEKHVTNSKTTYVGCVFTKVKFATAPDDITTQGENINFQSTTITGTAMKDGTNLDEWRVKSDELDSEAEADKYVRAVLMIETTELDELTIVSVPGEELGKTAISSTPALIDGRSYRYRTGPSIAMPELYDDLSGWTPWNGVTEITATTGDKIIIAEVDGSNQAMAAGIAMVKAKDTE